MVVPAPTGTQPEEGENAASSLSQGLFKMIGVSKPELT